jgi:serine/threonine protein kinase
VKRCVRKETGELRAVKIIRNNDAEMMRAIKTEFLIQKKLSHPNVVQAYELYFNPWTSHIQIVMELVEGCELLDAVVAAGRLPGTGFLILAEDEAKQYFREILQAIEYMHRKGVCHRDLKPQNVLLDKCTKHVKVTDFNVSKYFLLQEGAIPIRVPMSTHTGTMAYMAPEALSHAIYTYENTLDTIARVWTFGEPERSCTRCSPGTHPSPLRSIFPPSLVASAPWSTRSPTPSTTSRSKPPGPFYPPTPEI